jgi:hypothetical protein
MIETCRVHGKLRSAYKIAVGKREGRYYLKGLDVCRRIILKCILIK